MRVLGFDIRRAGGSPLRVAGTEFAARSVLAASPVPTFQAQPVSRRDDRIIPPDPYSGWWLSLPPKLDPKQVETILYEALAGSLWRQAQLTDRILDSWVMARKCCDELFSTVAAAKYVVNAFALPGKDPTPRAQEKADLVSQAMMQFRPDRFSDEEGWGGMIYDLCSAMLNGVSIVELIWDKPKEFVRAGAWVHPRHYAFGQNLRLGIARSEPTSLLKFPMPGTVSGVQDLLALPSKFLVAKYKSKSGSVLSSGLIRVLAYYWTTIMYGRDFLIAFSQKFGNPFLDIAYQAGIPQTEIDQFEVLAKRAANQGFCVHPNSGVINIHAAQSLGTNNPIIEMIRMADEACQHLLLRQTLTSSTPDKGGSRAQGEVHLDVKNETVETLCKWIASSVLTEQFAESLLVQNYGESSERPTVAVDLTRPLSAAEKGQFLQNVSNSTVPLPVEPVYRILDMQVPQPGETALVRGEHVVMEEAVTPTEKRDQMFEQQLGQQQAIGEMQGQAQDDVEASLRQASDDDLTGLRALVVKAKSAGRLNGEWAEIQARVRGLNKRGKS